MLYYRAAAGIRVRVLLSFVDYYVSDGCSCHATLPDSAVPQMNIG